MATAGAHCPGPAGAVAGVSAVAVGLDCLLEVEQPGDDLVHIPGTFAGCCATFGAAGEWRLILPSLVIGALFGYLMKASGLWLSDKTRKAQAANSAVDPA